MTDEPGVSGRTSPAGRSRVPARPSRVAPAWVLAILAFVVVIALGTIGFTRHQEVGGAVDPLTTRIYLALQLFVLEGGAVAGPVPWELDVARVAAPAVAAWAVVLVVASLFREELEVLRVRALRGHTVVVGLGRRSRAVVDALAGRGARVVVVEQDPVHPALAAIRARGVPVVVGDARLRVTLGRAGVGRAARVVVLTADDATNLEVAAAARDAVVARDGVASPAGSERLEIVAHLGDPDLALLLWAAEAERYDEAPARLDFVNVDAAAARAILAAWPVERRPDGGAPHAAIVGTGPLAREILLAMARGHAGPTATPAVDPPADGPLDVTLVGGDGPAIDAIVARHPEVARRLRIRRVERVRDAWTAGSPDPVLVCPGDDRAAARAALELRGSGPDGRARIVVVVDERAGLGALLDGAHRPGGGPGLAVFPLLEAACDPDTLLAGPTELLARALHAAYLADTPPDPGDPAHGAWDVLPEALRASNRDQATHVAVKLAAVGRAIGPLGSWDDATAPFGADEVETMARLEHERWMAERRRGGWRAGPRDATRQTTPYLVPWEELSEDVRDLDRLFIRRLPALLAGVGLQAHRVRPDEATAPTTAAVSTTPTPAAATTSVPSTPSAGPGSAPVGRQP